MMIVLRALLFNILFYGFSTLMCVVCIPFILFPRFMALGLARLFCHVTGFLERAVLGLTYEVRGLEYLPQNQSFIVAAKHQSAYETLKLFALFGNPAVILKRELLLIPIWGWFLGKLDMIAINRRNREESINSIIEGARRIRQQNRPIVIFPQGTRTRTDATPEDKPYKGGIIKMYTATDLPIVPMALNSGLFWGRKSFMKYGGTVVFEFLPPIEPGLPEKKVMKALEERIEETSNRLMLEAKERYPALTHIPTPRQITDNTDQ